MPELIYLDRIAGKNDGRRFALFDQAGPLECIVLSHAVAADDLARDHAARLWKIALPLPQHGGAGFTFGAGASHRARMAVTRRRYDKPLRRLDRGIGVEETVFPAIGPVEGSPHFFLVVVLDRPVRQ